jgi:hypothetical protein
LAWLAVSSVEAAQQIQKKSLEIHIQGVIGRDAVVNCGEYQISTPRSVPILQKSLVCAENAAKQHEPFRIVVHGMSEDSSVADGVLSVAYGPVVWFHYDSAPCGGPMCAKEFDTTAY